MEVGLHERQLAHRDVYIGIRGRICDRSSNIAKNGYIAKVTEIESPGRNMRQSTHPCLTESDQTKKKTQKSETLTVIVDRLASIELYGARVSETILRIDKRTSLQQRNSVDLSRNKSIKR